MYIYGDNIVQLRCIKQLDLMYLLNCQQVKQAAKADFFKGAGRLVEDTLEQMDPESAQAGHVHVKSLQRAANRARERTRPKHPKDLDFEVIVITFCHNPTMKITQSMRHFRHIIL